MTTRPPRGAAQLRSIRDPLSALSVYPSLSNPHHRPSLSNTRPSGELSATGPSSVRRSIGILHPVPPPTRWRRTKGTRSDVPLALPPLPVYVHAALHPLDGCAILCATVYNHPLLRMLHTDGKTLQIPSYTVISVRDVNADPSVPCLGSLRFLLVSASS